MNNSDENNYSSSTNTGLNSDYFDFTYVHATARIALYDDLRSAPRIVEIPPSDTVSYIENLASKVYELSKMSGGEIPYTVIREVSENFIHARFKEIIVSILDNGNTIRFADQGPGILNKEKAQLPGFSSAIEPMKHYIRGVGSGLPIVKEYLDFSHGNITIEDNLGTGSVVTISIGEKRESRQFPGSSSHKPTATQSSHQLGRRPQVIMPPLSQREKLFLPLFLSEGALGVTEISKLTEVPMSSTHVALQKLEQAGLVEKVGQKRMLTDFGFEVAQSL
ncbi:MAG: ATP-binding protein [Eggerthellaceae bacterium]|nr:ATP-binding protein [Eggerthellaceae bacterium]